MCSARDSLFCTTDLTLKLTSDKKMFNIKVVRLVERSRLILGSFPSEIVYHHKKDPQDAASLNRTILDGSDKTNPTRVLDVNPSLFLAREVQPPLIYLRGDG